MTIDKEINKVYFLGIGGIGMSALARYFVSQNVEVHGYDLTKTPLTKKLEEEGMMIHYHENEKLIPKDVDLAVFTPAIPSSHKELNWLQDHHYPVLKRAEVLGQLSQEFQTIAVAGTHGKTTTSAIIAHLLKKGQIDITAFLGGIMVNEGVNFLLGKSEYLLVEADEFDRSFLHLYPKILIVLSMDADHLDIYGDVDNMREAYFQLISQIQEGGHLILGPGVLRYVSTELIASLQEKKVEVSCIFKDFDFNAIKIKDFKYNFVYEGLDRKRQEFSTRLPGLHNLFNLSSAIYVSQLLGISLEKLSAAVSSFKGIKRRFELVYEGTKIVVDDYAHHPEELRYTIDTLLRLYPSKKVAVIFQPHLYSRTKEFYRKFASELSRVDIAVLLPIYPAREKAIKGVKSEMIYNLIKKEEKYLFKEDEFIDRLKEMDFDILCTIGAADLDKHHDNIIKEVINN